ncbi:MAG: restriction endonuclease subunit S [Proteobacteria bacterium]|nr:restriction endonuclease subunit S [Pseudomonadota bacterium]
MLFTGSGETAEEIGKCVAFLGSEEAFAGGDIIILSPNGYDSTFLGFLLNSDKIVKQKCKMAQGDAVVHIYANNLGKVMVASPPTKAEQTAIATALSDADELISSLEELITKKKNIKQGTMQQLLTGKKRLPGFGGGWEVKKLGTMIKLQGGYAFKSDSFQNEGVPIVRISNIDNSYVDLNDVVYYKEFLIPNEFVVNKGDVLIAMSGATTGKIGIYNFNFYSYQNQRVGKFVVYNSKKNDLNFISHLVRSERFKNNLQKQIAQGAQPNISGKQIESIELDIPVNIAEQTAIANILSDMDAEIGSLEQKRDKYKMIKQGMMQELLTGKTRLV